jgi:hypothetical protein
LSTVSAQARDELVKAIRDRYLAGSSAEGADHDDLGDGDHPVCGGEGDVLVRIASSSP